MVTGKVVTFFGCVSLWDDRDSTFLPRMLDLYDLYSTMTCISMTPKYVEHDILSTCKFAASLSTCKDFAWVL